MSDIEIHGMGELEVMNDGRYFKPYLRLKIGNHHFYITTNLAEMIGGAGAGARLRHEDQQRERGE